MYLLAEVPDVTFNTMRVDLTPGILLCICLGPGRDDALQSGAISVE